MKAVKKIACTLALLSALAFGAGTDEAHLQEKANDRKDGHTNANNGAEPFHQEYSLETSGIFGFNLNGKKKTFFEYKTFDDSLHPRGAIFPFGEIRGSTEISFLGGSVYCNLDMITRVDSAGYPVETFIITRNEDTLATTRPYDLVLMAKEGFKHAPLDSITDIYHEFYARPDSSSPPDGRVVYDPKHGSTYRFDSKVYDPLSCVLEIITHPYEGTREFPMHYNGKTLNLPVTVSKMQKKRQRYYHFSADIPEDMFNDISSIEFDFQQGQPPDYIRARTTAFLAPDVEAFAFPKKIQNNPNKR